VEALSDGPSVWPLPFLAQLLEQLRDIDALVKQRPFLEAEFSKSLQESA
jgi:3-deoxy-D-manno-octulosonic acid (KDO) 8-phosphate synthase